jgi:hypothetical protein
MKKCRGKMTTKRAAILVLALVFGVMGWAGSVLALTIMDDYIGAGPTHPSYYGRDIIGAEDRFSVTRMEVNLAGDQFVVDIYSTYFDNIGRYGTELGDLFISTDGWRPVALTELDNFHNGGEKWELVIALDNHRSGSGGVARLHVLDPTDLIGYRNDILLSEDLMDGSRYIFRQGQEVQYRGSGPALTEGFWDIPGDLQFLRISIDAMGLGWNLSDLSSLGFHWTMTCGNDVIEGGSVAIPEPGTVFLLGVGLIAMAAVGGTKCVRPN